MAHVTPALASVFCGRDDSALWSKLEDDDQLSQLCSKYWGKNIEDEAKQWRKLHPIVDDPTNDIGPGCYALDLGIARHPSKLWVRQDYIRMYDYCSQRYAEGPSSATNMARSVVITGQPGIGVFLSSVASCALSDNRSREKVNHIGPLTPSVVVSAKRNHFSGIVGACASYLSRMGCLNDASRTSLPITLRRSYGHSSIRTEVQVAFPKHSVVMTRTSILFSSLIRSDNDGRP